MEWITVPVCPHGRYIWIYKAKTRYAKQIHGFCNILMLNRTKDDYMRPFSKCYYLTLMGKRHINNQISSSWHIFGSSFWTSSPTSRLFGESIVIKTVRVPRVNDPSGICSLYYEIIRHDQAVPLPGGRISYGQTQRQYDRYDARIIANSTSKIAHDNNKDDKKALLNWPFVRETTHRRYISST